MRTKICLALACLAIAACGGDNPTASPPPPPPAERVTTVTITAPTVDSIIGTNRMVNLSASAETVDGTTAPSYAWQIDGTSVGSGQSISASLKPGANNVCVTASASNSVQSCKIKTFVPHFTCSVNVVDSTSLGQNLIASFSRNDTTETTIVGPNGDCSMNSALALGSDADTVRVVLDAPAGVTRLYHPMIGYASHADMVSGIPIHAYPFTHADHGTYTGTVIQIDLQKAYTPGTDGSTFFLRGMRASDSSWFYGVSSFPQANLPLPAFILAKPETVSQEGVDTLTVALDKYNKSFGRTFFQTPVVKDMPFSSDGALMIVLDSTACRATPDARACTTNDSHVPGDYDGGAVYFTKPTFITTGTAQHEAGHLNGLGHGCGWHSVMNQACDWLSPNFPFKGPADSLTAEDVGYEEIMMLARQAERDDHNHSHFSLAAAYQGERVLMLHLPEQHIIYQQ